MGLNSGAVRALPIAHLLVRPEVADPGAHGGRITEIVVVDRDVHGRRAAVEQQNGAAAASERLHPDFLVAVLGYAMTLYPKLVLVDRNHVLVGKDRARAL